MKTYKDLIRASISDLDKGHFCEDAVSEFRGTLDYIIAADAETYFARHNATIEQYQKKLMTFTGRSVPDIFSANYKIKSLIFPRLVTQQAMYVLGNGVKLINMENKKRLGKRFDKQLQKLAIKALVDGAAFGFWNYDHLEVFGLADTPKEPAFCPIYDDKTAALRAGIRFWSRKIGDSINRYYTLYEEDGITDFAVIEGDNDITVVNPKRAYITTTISTAIGGVEQVIGENYSTLPIVPLYANDQQQSELVGIRESIDAYDLIKSGFANDVDDASGFYWVLKNAGGMDDEDLARFVQRIKSSKAAAVDEDGAAEAHTLDVPVTAREALLDRLERDIYKDFQALDISSLSAAQKTAQEIQAAYQPMDNKCALFEYQIIDFMDSILSLAGMPDEEASFAWNKVTNMSEQTNMVLSAANYLSEECLIAHLPFLTPEEAAEEIEKRNEESINQFNAADDDKDEEAKEELEKNENKKNDEVEEDA